MTLHQLFISATRPKAYLTTLFSVVGLLSPNLRAQQQSFRMVPESSTAKLFIGTRENPRTFGIGVARASGEASIDTTNVEASTFNVIVYAGFEASTSDPDRQALAGDQPVISFHSQQVTERNDGSLEIDGQLTVTKAIRNQQVSTGEDYSGVRHVSTRFVHASQPATFVLAVLTDESGDGAPASSSEVRLFVAQQALPASGLMLTATSTVNGEVFPELRKSIVETAWPAVTSNVECATPSSAGEDYSGLQCSEDIVESVSPPALPVQVGEGYSGLNVRQPNGGQVTIDLVLVVKTDSAGNAATSQTLADPMGKAIADILESAVR